MQDTQWLREEGMLATLLTLVAMYVAHSADKHGCCLFLWRPRNTHAAHVQHWKSTYHNERTTRALTTMYQVYTTHAHATVSCRVACTRVLDRVRTHAVSKRTVKNQKSKGENVKAVRECIIVVS
jgi:hypothetical protein